MCLLEASSEMLGKWQACCHPFLSQWQISLINHHTFPARSECCIKILLCIIRGHASSKQKPQDMLTLNKKACAERFSRVSPKLSLLDLTTAYVKVSFN